MFRPGFVSKRVYMISNRVRPCAAMISTPPLLHVRGGIDDERVPWMAAEALAHVLISHGTCRMAWAEQGKFSSLFDLMRCAFEPIAMLKRVGGYC